MDDANLGSGFVLADKSDGWQYFSVSFSPERVSRDRVVALITQAGGRVLPRPPLAATEGPRQTIWAKVGNCACAGDPYAKISTDLAEAGYDVELKLGPATKDSISFSATIDPRATPVANVVAILRQDGATILSSSPP